MLHIRYLNRSDTAAFAALRLEALQSEPLAFGADAQEFARQDPAQYRGLDPQPPNGFTLGAFANERLVGMVGFVRNSSPKSQHSGVVWGMYLRPEARSKGWGRLLMQSLLDEARKAQGLEQITLAVSSRQTAAVGLYSALGFEEWGYEVKALKVGKQYTDLIHMVLRL